MTPLFTSFSSTSSASTRFFGFLLCFACDLFLFHGVLLGLSFFPLGFSYYLLSGSPSLLISPLLLLLLLLLLWFPRIVGPLLLFRLLLVLLPVQLVRVSLLVLVPVLWVLLVPLRRSFFIMLIMTSILIRRIPILLPWIRLNSPSVFRR